MSRQHLDVLLVGLDAAAPATMESLFESGAAPTLQELFTSGTHGTLRSQIPPWAPSAWPSLYTGRNPGRHGVFDVLTFDGYDWSVVDASHVRERTLLEYLDHHGYTSVAVNGPVTHPPPTIDGAVVPGYLAPEEPQCYPPGLFADIESKFGDYRIYPDADATGRDLIADYCELAASRGRVFRWLADRFGADFGFLQFQVTDTVFHEFPGDDDAVRTVYETVDETLADVIADCAPETVFVVSDHGMAEYGGTEFRVNEYLAREGFVETTSGGAGMPTWSTALETSLRNGTDPGTRVDAGVGERLLALVARAGLTTQRATRVLDALGLTDTVGRFVPRRVSEAAARQVDFAASEAYMRSRSELGVRINLAGREPDGVVPPASYEHVRDDLVETLSAVTTPDGNPVFETVARRERFFDGPYVDRAVDVVTVPADFQHLPTARLDGSVFDEPRQPYNHTLSGVVAATGAAVGDAPIGNAHLFDVAPSILAAMDVPPDERMDGRVLGAIDAVERERYPPYRPDGRTSDRDDERVTDHLTNLGYLE